MMFTMRPLRVKSDKDLPKEEKEVVKGTARRIVVVKSPDKKVFEEAIFIVREDYMHSSGITQSELMRQAREAARGYVGRLRPTEKKRRPALISIISALAGSGIAVLVMKIFGI